MYVAQQEDPLAQRRNQVIVHAPVEAAADRRRQAIQQPRLVLLRAQLANKPGARVGQRLVIDIDRVLGGQHQPHAKRAGLLQHAQHRLFGGRVANGGQIAKNLVEVDQGTQRGAPLLGSHPRFNARIEQRYKKHPLRFRQMGDVEDGVARTAVWHIQQARHIQRFPLNPGLKGRRGQNIVQGHRQVEALFFREEGVDVEDAQFGKRRGLGLHDQAGQV